MTTAILVGGNGYIGREVTRQWLQRDPAVQLIVTSREDRHEIEDPRVQHVQVDAADAAAFESALPASADYVVTFTYGSNEVLENIRGYAEKHGAQAVGNVGIGAVELPGFEDFVAMKKAELEFLRAGAVRVANVDATVVYGADRDDDLAKAVRSGALHALPPISVEVVAQLLIDRLVRAWAA
ncbi:NAD(P)H-binding protein [Tsukamurella pseudospumae]|uniref:NAD(P)-binding domain-containing protein n=1 Tax=Tsukamurella pseudospumae TaxID=239498 RepID=A0A137ZXQ6_9ACTN|nr:NAD(P)H-binding protein [Tsukamurella pseudospumae]KXP02975.1 hypothetical protein AXK60_13915 [Tsukamurella pseudospumae]